MGGIRFDGTEGKTFHSKTARKIDERASWAVLVCGVCGYRGTAKKVADCLESHEKESEALDKGRKCPTCGIALSYYKWQDMLYCYKCGYKTKE